MNTLILPNKIKKDIRTASESFGVSESDFVVNAVLYYSHAMKSKIDFRNELEMWEHASDVDLLAFEKTI